MTRFHRSGPLYVPTGMGKLTLQSTVSANVPMPSYVPTSEQEIDSWVSEQMDVWSRPDVQEQIKQTRAGIEAAVETELPFRDQMVMDEDQAVAQITSHIAANGFPTTPEQGFDLTMSFLERQGEQMGFPPAVLGAAALMDQDNWPQTPEQGAQWMLDAGVNLGRQYGLPIPTSTDAKSLITSGASATMNTAGIPGVAVVTTSIDALWDGKITTGEVRNIAGAAGSVVGAAVGQLFGIPAPIGAFVGGVVTTFVYDLIGKAFGFSETAADRRGKAWNDMLKAKAAIEAQCLEYGTQAWDSYNDYWNSLIGGLQTALGQAQPFMGDGLRYFGDVGVVALPKQFGGALWMPKIKYMEPVPYPIRRKATDWPYGSLYYASYQDVRGTYVREPAASKSRPNEMPNVSGTGNPAAGAWRVTAQGNYVDAYLAMAFWNAERYVTPWHGMMEYFGMPGTWIGDGATRCWEGGRMSGSYVQCWHDTHHTDREYLEAMSRVRSALRPEDLEMCKVPEWADFMFRSLDQAGPASKLVMQNIDQTVAAVAAEQGIAAQMEANMLQLQQAQQQAQLEAAQARFATAAQEYVSQQQAARLYAAQVAQARRDLLRERRAKASLEAQLNAGLFMSGVGALAGWAAAEILGRKK